jgi:hypothetical protein
MRNYLKETLGPLYEGNRHRGSVLGGENLEVYTEDHIAEHFPMERPHYE